MKWRRLNNVLHRDVGYLVVGLTLVYGVSGLAVNHRADWYALALIFMALSGMFVLQGRFGITGRGAWLVTIGVMVPLVYWMVQAVA